MAAVNNSRRDDKVILPAEMASEFRDPEWGAQQLKAIDIMKTLSVDELKKLYSRGEIRSYKPQSYAVIEGEPTRGLYIILNGTVSVYKNDHSTGAMHRLTYLHEGHSFGEMSLFDTAPRSATVAAETICHMFHLDADVFDSFLEQTGSDAKVRFYRGCAEDLVGRFRKLNADYIVSQQLLWKHALSPEHDEGKTHSATDMEKES